MLGLKKGEMTIRTIVAIALAVVILTFLIFGFSMGWGNFFDKVKNFVGEESNIDTIAQACSMSCSGGQAYAYCEEERELKDGEGNVLDGSCRVFSYGGYGIEKCLSIDCGDSGITDLSGEVEW